MKRHSYFTLLYAGFLVFITPLAIPFALYEAYQGHVQKQVWILAGLLYILSGLGITLGYHRLMTHRAFSTYPWLKGIFLLCGTWSMQGPPVVWGSMHIQHHTYSDKPGDPHSPVVQGFWQAHCLWLFNDYHPDFYRFGKWLWKDKVIRHISKYYLYYSNIGLIIPIVVGGWPGFLWAGCVRLFISSHVTWGINSICHYWGRRDYNTPENSKNNAWMGLLSLGEGWHNNHHRFMQSAYLGHRWYQIDIGKWVLLVLHRLRLIWDLKTYID